MPVASLSRKPFYEEKMALATQNAAA